MSSTGSSRLGKEVSWGIVLIALSFFAYLGAGSLLRPLINSGSADNNISVVEIVRAKEEGSDKSISQRIISVPDVVAGKPDILSSGKTIGVDLDTMVITLYQDGKELGKYDVKAIGKAGTSWETPIGNYDIKTKEKEHFSSIGTVYQPWSMQFYGNFFIHGWPYYEGGEPVSEGYSGGCIRLSTNDSKEVYDFAEYGTRVSVYRSSMSLISSEATPRRELTQDLTTSDYLVARLDSGEILHGDENKIIPLGEFVRPIHAFTSLDNVNQFSELIIEDNIEGASLKQYDVIKGGDLIYPLLLVGDEAALHAMKDAIGPSRFAREMSRKLKSLGIDSIANDEATSTARIGDIFVLGRAISLTKHFLIDIPLISRNTKTSPVSGETYVWERDFTTAGAPQELTGLMGGKSDDGTYSVAVIYERGTGEITYPFMIIFSGSTDVARDVVSIVDSLNE